MTVPLPSTDDEDVAQLIAGRPLAWIAARGNPAVATPMPLLLERDANGVPQSLLCHLPRTHPLVAAFTADPAGLFLSRVRRAISRPNGWRTSIGHQPGTFAVAMIEAEVTIDAGFTDAALRQLVAHMERDRAEPWTVEPMGDRYARLRERVIGFRARITGAARAVSSDRTRATKPLPRSSPSWATPC